MRMSRPASLLVGLALLASVTACSSDSDSPTGAEGSPSGSSTGQPSTSQPTSGTPASTAQDSKSNADAEIDFTVSDAGLVRAPGPKGLRAAAGDKVEFSLDNTSSSPYTMRLIDAKGKTLAQDS
ncbi:MAG: hypothetical protein ACRDQA_06755, partial [Nocardioidaceae bacterium]